MIIVLLGITALLISQAATRSPDDPGVKSGTGVPPPAPGQGQVPSGTGVPGYGTGQPAPGYGTGQPAPGYGTPAPRRIPTKVSDILKNPQKYGSGK